MNKKLLEQLALAKQAGSQAMAKDFFAKTPSPGTDPTADDNAPPAGAEGSPEEEKGELPEEELQELLQLLQAREGGQADGGQG